MAKKAYIGIDGKARKITKGYVGIEDKARKIKKAYIGIGGVARPFWSSEPVEWYGYLDSVYRGSSTTVTITATPYKLVYGSSEYQNVETFDKNLTLSRPIYDGIATADKVGFTASSIDKYAIFAGGHAELNYQNSVDCFDSQTMTRVSISSLSSTQGYLSGESNSNYAVFAAGYYGYGSDAFNMDFYERNKIECYDKNLSKRTISIPIGGAHEMGWGHINDTCIFAGGKSNFYPNETQIDKVFALKNNLTTQILTSLKEVKDSISSASTDKYLIFAGGRGASSPYYLDTVEVYDAQYTKTLATPLSFARYPATGNSSYGKGAVFFGGWRNGAYSTYVERYDENLTKTMMPPLLFKWDPMVTKFGDYMFLVAGWDDRYDNETGIVGVYKINNEE